MVGETLWSWSWCADTVPPLNHLLWELSRLAAVLKKNTFFDAVFLSPRLQHSHPKLDASLKFLLQTIIITFIFYFLYSWKSPFCGNHQCWSPSETYSTGYILVMSVTVKDAKGVRLIFRSGYGRMGTTSGPPIVFRIERHALVIRASASHIEIGSSGETWKTGLHDQNAAVYIEVVGASKKVAEN